MRGALLGLLCLLSSHGCARAPSSVPLGGQEWVRPEPHADRKAPEGPSAKTASATPAAAAAATPGPSASTPSAGSTPAPVARVTPDAGQVAFAFKPLARGDVVTLRTRYALRASLTLSAAGTTTSQTLEADASERLEVRVVDASAQELRELDVEYAESKADVRVASLPSTGAGKSNAGKRYRVRVSGGSATVSAASGALEPDEDKGVLFDLATVMGYVPLVKPHLPASIARGFGARVSSSELAGMFGGLDAVRFDSAQISLRGRDSADTGLAVFDCSLPVRFARDAIALSAELGGTFTVRLSDSRPVSVRLRGPLGVDGKIPLGDGSRITGTLEVHLEHAYRR